MMLLLSSLSPGIWIALLLIGAALLGLEWRYWSPPSTPAGYHSRRAGAVLVVGLELVSILILAVSEDGLSLGHLVPSAQSALILLAGAGAWTAFQKARRRWPAGSD
jgi:hypothetical protein